MENFAKIINFIIELIDLIKRYFNKNTDNDADE